jgi:hypothetical protein
MYMTSFYFENTEIHSVTNSFVCNVWSKIIRSELYTSWTFQNIAGASFRGGEGEEDVPDTENYLPNAKKEYEGLL